METISIAPSYKGFRFPQDIIGHAVWLSHRFTLSFAQRAPDVAELLAARGVMVSYETVRQWSGAPWAPFGQQFAHQRRRRRAQPGDTWHCDEVLLKINGKRQYLWRAVDQDGNVLDLLVQSRRNKAAALTFVRKPGAPWAKGCSYRPRVLITAKLASYGAAKREVLAGVEQRQSRYLNNRAENSHQPPRKRERVMQRFTSAGHAQRFLAAFTLGVPANPTTFLSPSTPS